MREIKKVDVEATAWNWECPDEDCEYGNWTDEKDIDWTNDPPFTAVCKSCGKTYVLNL